MSKKPTTTSEPPAARYEYRVWGKQPRARQLLEKLASTVSEERVKDCYLLAGDGSWNAKVRNNRLKVKQLIAEDRGFERWSADRPRSAGDAPEPFDVLFEQLRLDRPQRGKSYDLYDAVDRLEADPDTKVVFVVKQRKRYTVGRLRAEATDIEIVETSEVMYTLAIEGEDLDDLVALRERLGLRDEPNLAVHTAIALTAD